MLDAMGIDVWVPRSKPKPTSVPEARSLPRAVESDRREPASAPPEISTGSKGDAQAASPAVEFKVLSLRCGGHHALIDDSIHQERAFWLDVLRASHGFDAGMQVREGRFDWPLAGLPEADAEAAQKALHGYVQADALIWVRGDALASMLLGAGRWQSFPQRLQLAQAEVWVFGSDMRLLGAEGRRALWAALEALHGS